MRSALIETLSQDYFRTARASGLTFFQAVKKHAFRNALIPVLTIIGLQFSYLIAGAIIIEIVATSSGEAHPRCVLTCLLYTSPSPRD